MPKLKNINIEVYKGLMFGVFVHYKNINNLTKKITEIEPNNLYLVSN